MTDLPESKTEQFETGVDIAGVGKAMRAIPPESWQQLVDVACMTVEKTLSPITETAHGIGRLIRAKFDRLIDIEQIMAAESITSAQKKAELTRKSYNTPRPKILLQVIENAASEVDSGVREMWSNLLAQEMLTQSVHPEIGRVLARMSFEDAQLLAGIAEEKPTSATRLFAKAVSLAFRASSFGGSMPLGYEPETFNHSHLENLGLIARHDGEWRLTVFGTGFIKTVTDPSLPPE